MDYVIYGIITPQYLVFRLGNDLSSPGNVHLSQLRQEGAWVDSSLMLGPDYVLGQLPRVLVDAVGLWWDVSITGLLPPHTLPRTVGLTFCPGIPHNLPRPVNLQGKIFTKKIFKKKCLPL